MKFVSKVIDPINNFWVEDYTEEEKEFFLSIGFKETVQKIPESFGGDFKYLHFQGSGNFGMWSQEEQGAIAQAIYDQFPDMEEITVYEMNPHR